MSGVHELGAVLREKAAILRDMRESGPDADDPASIAQWRDRVAELAEKVRELSSEYQSLTWDAGDDDDAFYVGTLRPESRLARNPAVSSDIATKTTTTTAQPTMHTPADRRFEANQRLTSLQGAITAIIAAPTYDLLRHSGLALDQVQRYLRETLATGQYVWAIWGNGSEIARVGVHPEHSKAMQGVVEAHPEAACYVIDADAGQIASITGGRAQALLDKLDYVTDSVHRQASRHDWQDRMHGRQPDYVTDSISRSDSGGGKGRVVKDGEVIADFHTEAGARLDGRKNSTRFVERKQGAFSMVCFRSAEGRALSDSDLAALQLIAKCESDKHHTLWTELASVTLDGRELSALTGSPNDLHKELDVLRVSGMRSEFIPDVIAHGGYAQFALDPKNQDICEPLMVARHYEIRNTLRTMGWDGEKYKTLYKDGAALHFADLNSPTTYNCTNFELVAKGYRAAKIWPLSFDYARMPNDMRLSAEEWAQQFDAAVTASLPHRPTQQRYASSLIAIVAERDAAAAMALRRDLDVVAAEHGDNPDAQAYSNVIEAALDMLPVERDDETIDMQLAHRQGRLYEHNGLQDDGRSKFIVLSAQGQASVPFGAGTSGWFVSASGRKHASSYPNPIEIHRNLVSPLKPQLAHAFDVLFDAESNTATTPRSGVVSERSSTADQSMDLA